MPPSSPSSNVVHTTHESEEGDLARGPRGIQSVEVGGQLLAALTRTRRRMALKDLAKEAAMTPAKAHPYLVSFCKIGLIEQDRVSGHYGLGPMAIKMGLISLQQADPVRMAAEVLPDLAQQVGYTLSVAMWSPQGPIIVRVEEGPTHVYVAIQHGTVTSVHNTATGKIFAAFGDPHVIESLLQAEQHSLQDGPFSKELAEIRANGFSFVKDELLQGVSALAVPVFDCFGRLVLAIAAIGPSVTLTLDPEGLPVQLLKAQAHLLSQRLGQQ